MDKSAARQIVDANIKAYKWRLQVQDWTVGVRYRKPDNPEWPVIYLELPTGQVSWHMLSHRRPWDGHTTEEKFQRIREYVALTKMTRTLHSLRDDLTEGEWDLLMAEFEAGSIQLMEELKETSSSYQPPVHEEGEEEANGLSGKQQ